jgi:hypothetical protein
MDWPLKADNLLTLIQQGIPYICSRAIKLARKSRRKANSLQDNNQQNDGPSYHGVWFEWPQEEFPEADA